MNDMDTSEQQESLQIISFKLEDMQFASDILRVQKVISMMEIRPVPRSPVFVKGVINLRGQIIPIVDLRTQFGLPPSEVEEDQKIIIFSHQLNFVGFIVDEVSQVIRKNFVDIMPAPPVTIIFFAYSHHYFFAYQFWNFEYYFF